MTREAQLACFSKLVNDETPCIIVCKGNKCADILRNIAIKRNFPIFVTNMPTGRVSIDLQSKLDEKLAPETLIHGVFLNIYGKGVIIRGDSGIGKSEIALELVKRGHQLIADDLVMIMEKEPGNLIGTSPDILKRFMEIRGIGIVDVINMFGASSYRERKNIRLVVELEKWDEGKYYDRLGLDNQKIKYFNTEISKVTIPVLPGRTVSLLVESAAMNEKIKLLGHNSAEEFVSKVDSRASNKEE